MKKGNIFVGNHVGEVARHGLLPDMALAWESKRRTAGGMGKCRGLQCFSWRAICGKGKAEKAAGLWAREKRAKGLFHAEIEGLLSLGQMEEAAVSKWHAGVLHAEKEEESAR